MRVLIILSSLCVIVPSQSFAEGWNVNGPYDPDTMYTAYISAIADVLKVPSGPQSRYWLSLAPAGYPYEPTDTYGINLYANFRPPVSSNLIGGEAGSLIFDANRRLDFFYEHVLDNMVFPPYTPSNEYLKAVEILQTVDDDGVPDFSPIYLAYRKAVRMMRTKEAIANSSPSPEERQNALLELPDLRAKKDQIGGSMQGDDPEKSLFEWLDIFGKEVGAKRARLSLQRNADLQNFRDVNGFKVRRIDEDGKVTEDVVTGVRNVPLSVFSPPIDTWSKGSGWSEVKFKSSDTHSSYEKHVQRIKARGGLSIGFLRVGGRGGRTKVKEERVNSVNKFGFEFKIKRIAMFRPWFDREVFQSEDWTWKKPRNVPDKFPLIALGPGKDGGPQRTGGTYEGKPVELALLPSELILVKDVSVTAVVSKADWEKIENTSSGGAGVSLFGFSFGGSADFEYHRETEDKKNVEFKFNAPDIMITGTISEVIPKSPNPDKTFEFGENALLPDGQ